MTAEVLKKSDKKTLADILADIRAKTTNVSPTYVSAISHQTSAQA